MNLTGQLLQRHVPGFVRHRALRQLFQATAEAFGVPIGSLAGVPAGELLQRYAAFTRDHAMAALESGDDVASLKTRLFDSAYVRESSNPKRSQHAKSA